MTFKRKFRVFCEIDQNSRNSRKYVHAKISTLKVRFRLPGSLATKFLLLRSPAYTHKISTASRLFAQGVNGNEPIENMQLYMGYSLEKLERRLALK